MRYFLSLFNIKLPVYYVYMLQQVEYDPRKFWGWGKDLIEKNIPVSSVMTRKTLIATPRAKMMLVAAYGFLLISLGVELIILAGGMSWIYWLFGAIFWLLSTVFITLNLFLYCLTAVAHILFIKPEEKRLIVEASRIFAESKAIKIAILGSYGKTTMKEVLNTVLSEGKKVATTPGNMNVSTSHARFAKTLSGNEEVIIVEFGEGEPGDIARMASMLKPDYAIITGLAPNHLDRYSSLKAVADDLLEIYRFVSEGNIYANGESLMLQEFLLKNEQKYNLEGAMGWKTSNINISIQKLSFNLLKSNISAKVESELLGRHQVAPISLVVGLAEKLGLSVAEIESGVRKTKTFKHRMQPRNLHGAWMIDDTYNGNLEGLQAGLRLLSELEAKRKWYITPGLVDQGNETERVHQELGIAIAKAQPDIVVLMENSVRKIIEDAMKQAGFSGELRIEQNPLEFYTNIEHVVAAGDIALMQNDWTDNYN